MGYQEAEPADNEAPLEVIDDLLKECALLQIDIAPAEATQKGIDFHVPQAQPQGRGAPAE